MTMAADAAHPRPPLPLPLRFVFAVGGLIGLVEAVYRAARDGFLETESPAFADLAWPALRRYESLRAPVALHPSAVIIGVLVTAALLILTARAALLVWHNHIVARATGSRLTVEDTRFPMTPVDVLAEVGRRPPGTLFVGLTPMRSWFRWRYSPVYISQRQKTMHRHVVGKTGSGKTASVLWPAVLQDALDGKGVLVMDAKGSDENIRVVKAIARLAGRAHQLRIFALPAWNQRHLPSHTYNMVSVRPRTPTDSGGDPVATAERVFAALTPELGDNQYYNTQARIMFDNLCRLLHGMVDERGFGLPFTLRDLGVCFKGIGGESGQGWLEALNECRLNSKDQEAAREVTSQLARLGPDVRKVFSGIIGALDKFQSPLVNAYDPDIVFEEVLEKNLIVYVQLPANLFPIQAKAMGRMMLLDVQQEGSLRQVFRQTRNQTPFSVNIDEFYTFADISVIDSLNKLRDAHLEYTLAHQSLADLELVSKEFAAAVWDNTRTKDILSQDNPELCEKLAKSIGTYQGVELTIRRQQGALMTQLVTGDASSRLVETYKLHPNAIKNLARCGQGYIYNDEGIRSLVYGMLPSELTAQDPIEGKNQQNARGLKLYERFIARRSP
jgi:hypothetical protein